MKSKKRMFFLGVLFLITLNLSGATLYVTPQGDDGNDGLSWEGAKASIGAAVEAAAGEDEIWVQEGEYLLSDVILIEQPVALYGGFGGTETAREQRDWENRVTRINGQSIVDHCIKVLADVTVDGFTITGGYADGPGTDRVGGGLIGLGVSPVIQNCYFVDNYALMGGAGLDTWLCSPEIVNCRFSGNDSVAGGAVRIRESSPVFEDCEFFENNLNNRKGRGGGIYCWNSFTIVRRSLFRDNVTADGGGIGVIGGTITIEDSVFTGNTVTASGGAILLRDATGIVDRCTFRENQAYYGGVLSVGGEGSEYLISNSTMLGNRATNGGAIYLLDTTTQIRNCLIAGNRVIKLGGGIHVVGSAAEILNCTITENAAGKGAGLYTNIASAVTMYNTIMWDNLCTSPYNQEYKEFFYENGLTNHKIRYSCIAQEGIPGAGVINADPLFLIPGTLDINNTPDDYTDDFWSQGDYHLPEYSPAVNGGGYYGAVTQDINGAERPRGNDYDMGVYELPQPDLAPPRVVLLEVSEEQLIVTFNEPFTVRGNYSITPGVGINNILTGEENRSLTLETTRHAPGEYFLNLSGVMDRNGNTLPSFSIPYGIDQYGNVTTTSEFEVKRVYDPGIHYYHLSVDPGAGSLFISLELAEYIQGTQLEVRAIPPEGLVFDRWAGNYSGAANPLIVTMDQDISETPLFTVPPDLTAPVLEDVVPVKAGVTLMFNEPLDFSSVDRANFAITGGVSVLSAILLEDQQTIHLVTTTHNEEAYTITFNGVTDIAGNPPGETSRAYTYTPLDPGSLEAYWDFEDMSSGYVEDKSPYRITGILHNGASRGAGYLGGGVVLDGVDDYVDFGYSDYHLTSALTLSCWIKPVVVRGGEQIIIMKGPYNNPFMLRINRSGNIRTCLRADSSVYKETMVNILPGEWQHVALTYEDGLRKVYFNGRIASEDVVTGELVPDSNRNTTLGSTPLDQYYFGGTVDEMYIFSRALTEREVRLLANGEVIPAQEPVEDPDQNFYFLDIESSAEGTVIANPALTSYLEGTTVELTAEPGEGYEFDYWGGDAYGSANPLILTMDSDKIVIPHFKADSTAQPPELLSLLAVESRLFLEFSHPLDPYYGEDTNNYTISGGITVNDAVVEGAGLILFTSDHTPGDYRITLSRIVDLYGNEMAVTTLDYTYEALSTQGQVACWSFDAITGTEVEDSASGENTGTLVDFPRIITGVKGDALSFDGVDDGVDLGTGTFDLTTELSVSLWVYVEAQANTYQTLVQKSAYVDPFMLQVDGQNRIRAGIRTNTGVSYLTSDTVLNEREWYHIVLTYTDGARSLYINGSLTDRDAKTGVLSVSTTRNASMGISPLGIYPLNGALDEVFVYNRCLSAGEVTQLYLAFRGDRN